LARRFSARLIDALWIVPGGLLLCRVLALSTDLEWGWQIAAFAVFASALQLAVEPFFVSFLGATPGKALLGVVIADAATGRRLPYAAAVGRTVKAVAQGLGFWYLPLTALALVAALWRGRHGRGMPWDRDSSDGRVCIMAPRRTGRALLMMAAALVPGWLLPVAAMVIGFVLMAAKGIDAGQDISRALTGRWQWLHRLSGEQIALDARWRVLHDRMSIPRGEWNVVFAFGVGETNRVLLDVRLAPGLSTACLHKRFGMEEEGFVFIEQAELGTGGCMASGGKLAPGGVVLVRIDGHRSAAGDHTLTQVYRYADTQAREAAAALARLLTAQRGKADVRDRTLMSHYWRNELTGAVARLPGDWELIGRTANANRSVEFAFRRNLGRPVAEYATIFAMPWMFFDSATDPHEYLESRLLPRIGPVKVTRRHLGPNETVTNAYSDRGSAHLWTRRDRLQTWAAFWRTPDPGPQPEEPAQHALLRELRRTMR
jgi:hypothetical protein